MTNLVDDLMDFIGRFVVMTDDQRLIVALWVVHTHCLDAFEQTPGCHRIAVGVKHVLAQKNLV